MRPGTRVDRVRLAAPARREPRVDDDELAVALRELVELDRVVRSARAARTSPARRSSPARERPAPGVEVDHRAVVVPEVAEQPPEPLGAAERAVGDDEDARRRSRQRRPRGRSRRRRAADAGRPRPAAPRDRARRRGTPRPGCVRRGTARAAPARVVERPAAVDELVAHRANRSQSGCRRHAARRRLVAWQRTRTDRGASVRARRDAAAEGRAQPPRDLAARPDVARRGWPARRCGCSAPSRCSPATCFQAAALDRGRLAIIQPLLVTTVIFALPLGYFLTQQHVGRREVVGALVIVARPRALHVLRRSGRRQRERAGRRVGDRDRRPRRPLRRAARFGGRGGLSLKAAALRRRVRDPVRALGRADQADARLPARERRHDAARTGGRYVLAIAGDARLRPPAGLARHRAARAVGRHGLGREPVVSVAASATLLLDERLERPAWHVVVAFIGLVLALAGAVVISLAREATKAEATAPVAEPGRSRQLGVEVELELGRVRAEATKSTSFSRFQSIQVRIRLLAEHAAREQELVIASSASSDSASEPGTCGIRSWRLLEEVEVGRRARVDAAAGSRRCPASSIAENARYGFAVGSGQRNSIRFALGDAEYIGIRMQAERLRCE